MDFKLTIATPFYDVKAFAPYVVSLVDSINLLNKAGIDNNYYVLTGDSYVDRAKNTIVHKFLQSDATHLMMIDSDESWDIEGFARMLRAVMAGCEVVGALYPCKNNWEFFGGVPNYGPDGMVMGKEFEFNGQQMRLLDMSCIPGGYLIYSRASFERARHLLNTYTAPETGEKILEAFRCNVEPDGRRVGEDIYFQLRYREAGGTVWCEPDVTIGHWGTKEWRGNYHEYLLGEKAKNESSTGLGLTADDTKRLLAELAKNETVLKAMDDIAPIEGYDYLGDITKR